MEGCIGRKFKLPGWNRSKKLPEELSNILMEIESLSYIKYSAYRTALKIRRLQCLFGFDNLKFSHIVGILDLHGLRPGNGEILIDASKVESIVRDVLYSVKPLLRGKGTYDSSAKVEAVRSFLFCVYDQHSSKHIKSLCIQIFLAVISRGRLIDRYKYLFRLFADHNNCISRKNCAVLLQQLIKIPESLFERLSFGSHLIVPSIETLYKQYPSNFGIPESSFIKWLLEEPQSIVWLPICYRIQCCENVQHPVKCSNCKTSPIIGFRYQCLMCFGYDLCQRCFFTGQVNRKHDINHPLEEYCYPTTAKDTTRAYLKILKNHLPWRNKSKEVKSSLPVDISPELVEELADVLNSYCEVKLDEHEGDATLLSRTIVGDISTNAFSQSCAKEMESVIGHLDTENKLILKEVGNYDISHDPGTITSKVMDKQKLLKYNHEVEVQIQRLKTLLKKHEINNIKNIAENGTPEAPVRVYDVLPRLQSTPAIHSTRKAANFYLSPISPNNENEPSFPTSSSNPTVSPCHLESITEVSFKDLTTILPSNFVVSPSKSREPASFNNTQFANLDLNTHLEKLLEHLESAFPKEYVNISNTC